MQPDLLIEDGLELAKNVLRTQDPKNKVLLFYVFQSDNDEFTGRIPKEERTFSLDDAICYKVKYKVTLSVLISAKAVKNASVGIYKISQTEPLPPSKREKGLSKKKTTECFSYSSKDAYTDDYFANDLAHIKGGSFPLFVLYDSPGQFHSVIAFRNDLENFVKVYSSLSPALNDETQELVFLGKTISFRGGNFSLVKLLIHHLDSIVSFEDFNRCYEESKQGYHDYDAPELTDKVKKERVKSAYANIFKKFDKYEDLKKIFVRKEPTEGGFGLFIDKEKLQEFLNR